MFWIYKKGKIDSLEDFPKGAFGFIYEIEHIPTGKKYIGKKQLRFTRKLPPLKGQKRWRKVEKESDWLKYTGSHTFLKEIRKENRYDELRREILLICFTKKILTYNELKYQMMFEVLEESSYLNDNLLGKFYRKDFIRENESKSIIS
tara:strand:+ start:6073 stop:6513 length:441 start_codon:yes stop_codon:yes gene_type:complete